MKYIILSLALVLSIGASAQEVDKNIVKYFGKRQVSKLSNEEPDVLKFYEFLSTDGFEFGDFPFEKKPEWESVKIDEDDFNVFDKRFFPKHNLYQYYRIEDTDKMVLIYPLDLSQERFDKLNTSKK